MKPRVLYADLQHAAWLSAFEKVRQLGEGKMLGEWSIFWINDDPQWVQLSDKTGKVMVRKGNPLLIELVRAAQ